MVNFKRTVMAWALMLRNFSSIKMKGKIVTLQKLRHYTSLKFHHIYKILCTKLTRLSTSSYFTVGSQILQVRLVMLETKGLEIFGHGLCLLTEREECSDFNFCPAIL